MARPHEAAPPHAHRLQSRRFMWLYGLAWAGGAVSYVPFLTLLLPLRVADLAAGQAVQWLGYISFAGAIAASLGGIVFGWLSDISGTRNWWIGAGLVLNVALLMAMSQISSVVPLVAVLILWQFGLNMMLGPLAALGGDLVPDRQKGMLGGLLAFAPAAGAAAGAVITIPGLAAAEGRFMVVAAMIIACVLPLLLFGRPVAFPELMTTSPRDIHHRSAAQRGMVRMWIARLAVQISEAALFAYLLYYFRSINPDIRDADSARIFSVVLVVAIPLALFAGRWADRNGKAIIPLRWTAGLSAGGLVIMAASDGIVGALAGYILFGLATTVFLSLHASQMLRVLPRPSTRGRDLGLFNLTNTVPSLIMPWLTIAIVPSFGFAPLFWLLAMLAAFACILLTTINALPKAA